MKSYAETNVTYIENNRNLLTRRLQKRLNRHLSTLYKCDHHPTPSISRNWRKLKQMESKNVKLNEAVIDSYATCNYVLVLDVSMASATALFVKVNRLQLNGSD